jgi:hypothetical protein
MVDGEFEIEKYARRKKERFLGCFDPCWSSIFIRRENRGRQVITVGLFLGPAKKKRK